MPQYKQIYIDGSKREHHVGSAVILHNATYKWHLPNMCSSFSAEIHVIPNAVNMIEHEEHIQFVIFTDSASSIQAIKNLHHKCNYIRKT